MTMKPRLVRCFSIWAFISAVKGVTSMTFVTDSALSEAVTDRTALVTGIRTTSAILASRPGLNRVTNPPATMTRGLGFDARSRRHGRRSRRSFLQGHDRNLLEGRDLHWSRYFGGQHLLQTLEVRPIGGGRR